MHRRIGELIFWCAAAVALALYWLTVPDGLPWNGSVRLAEAYIGGGRGPGDLPHPIWGFYVKVFNGPIALSVTLAALAAGLVAVLVNRYFGWRFALSAALVWIFMPGVWNRAITGERGIVLAAVVVAAAWVVNAIVLRATRKVRAAKRSVPVGAAGGSAHVEEQKRRKVNRIAGEVAMGLAGLFALVSAVLHDYRLGEVASAYARLVVEEAGDRVIMLNGACNEQVEREVAKKKAGGESRWTKEVLSFSNTEANRSNIVAWVKREWPGETNLWLEAEIGPASFAEAAVKAHPERFYSMMGHSTTPEKLEARWKAMKPYLASRDPFVPVMKRLFAYERNFLAKAGKPVARDQKNERPGQIPDVMTLEKWHPEMMKAFREREYDEAVRIARAILARRVWRGFVPAHMVIGETMLMKGDLVAAESFLRVAVEAEGTAAPPPFVLNDYAETLRRLGRLEEAERYARRAVEESDEKSGWFCRRTLAEVLEEIRKKRGEQLR